MVSQSQPGLSTAELSHDTGILATLLASGSKQGSSESQSIYTFSARSYHCWVTAWYWYSSYTFSYYKI